MNETRKKQSDSGMILGNQKDMGMLIFYRRCDLYRKLESQYNNETVNALVSGWNYVAKEVILGNKQFFHKVDQTIVECKFKWNETMDV